MSTYESRLATMNPPATDSQVAQLEQGVTGSLPEDYRTFLYTSNGGGFALDNIAFQSAWGPQATVLQPFLSVERTIEITGRLRGGGYLPPTALAIAEDHGGNAIVLSTEQNDTFGAVFFWASERASSEQAAVETIQDFAYSLIPIAPSFEAFVTNLLQSESDAVQRYQELGNQPPLPMPAEPADAASAATGQTQVLHHKAKRFDLMPAPFRDVAHNDGQSCAAGWSPVPAAWNEHADSEPYDLLEAGSSVALRPAGRDAAGHIFERYGELLEFTTDTGPIFYFRCLNVVDGLSPATVVQTSDTHVSISQPIFDASVVAEAGIFTVPEQVRNARLFFTSDVAAEIAATGIAHRDFLPLDLPAQQM